MTDGIYKALESIYSIRDRRDVHRQLLQCIEQAKAKKCENIAENVVRNIAVLHYETFCNKIYAPDPADRKIGASCSKRDDMSIVIVEVALVLSS